MPRRRAANRRAASAAAAAVTLALLGCTVDDLDVSGMPCPCPSGFDCDDATQTCTRSADVSTGATGPGGSGASGGAGGGEPCPPDMVHAFDESLGVSFCIDRTETTQSAYVAFLLDVGNASGIEQPEACAFNTELTHTPDASCPSFTTSSDLPVWCVDWCDARAYCAWADKRLCGKIGGGALTPLDPGLVAQDEWYFACSRAYQRTYPYGDDPQPGYCNIPEENTPGNPDDNSDRAAVGSFEQCEGGFDGMFDMQGNVTEWTDWCAGPGDGSGDENCYLRGGHTFGTAEYWSCDSLNEQEPRNEADRREAGFRCCKDAAP